MTEEDDELLQALACLPPIRRDFERESDVRARCHATIAARVARREQSRKKRAAAKVVWFAAAAVLCFYLGAVFSAAARLGGAM